jgi:predicted Ser/Thr protein kinase
VYKTVRQVALKALRGRFNQQRFREFKHEAEMLQLLQGSSVRAILFPALLRCDRYVK